MFTSKLTISLLIIGVGIADHGSFPASFLFIFVFSRKHYNFYKKCMWKNVHPVYSARIQTHNLQNLSLLP